MRRLSSTFSTAKPSVMLFGAVIALIGWILVAAKWQAVLQSLGSRQPLMRLMSLTLASQLWGLLLPVPFSDEFYRSGQLAVADTPFSIISRAALLDRVSTLVATAVLGLVAAFLNRGIALDDRLLIAIAAAAFAPFLSYFVIKYPTLARLISSAAHRLLSPARVRAVEEGLAWLIQRPTELLAFLGLGAIVQLVFVAAMTEWSHGLGVSLSVEQIAWAMLASALLPYLLPIPGMSVIVQQGSFVYLLVAMGASTEQAGAVSLSSLALLLLFGAAGAVWQLSYAFSGRRGGRHIENSENGVPH